MKRDILIAAAVILAACEKTPEQSAPPPTPTVVQLEGAGSSFVAPLVYKWAEAFDRAHPDVRVDYKSEGSSAGVEQAMAGTVDFAGTEAPLTDEQMEKLAQDKGLRLYHLPAAIGGTVPAYNLPGVAEDLRFTPQVLAGIFLGDIKKWNDRAIASANPGVALPDSNIAVVHRSDGSGTTYVWTDYLSKASEEWKSKVGRGAIVQWPAGTEAKGNEGVSSKISATPYALGYVELVYAIKSKLQFGSVENRNGEFVKASFASLTAAAANARQSRPEDYRISLTNGEGPGVYPIAGFTWLLVPSRFSDGAKQKAVQAFLSWGLDRGQEMAQSLSYARLPPTIVTNERVTLGRIHSGGD